MGITRKKWLSVGLLGVLFLVGCSAGITENPLLTPMDDDHPAPTDAPVKPTDEVHLEATNTPIVKTTSPSSHADIMSVSVNGEQGAYNFSVTISSPDEGCNQYADWWEVVSQDGELLYRRILLHSHVNEQPFTRSGGPVTIEPDTIIWVRAHMHPTGYGGTAMKGSVVGGFEPTGLGLDFATQLADTPPLPEGCDF